MKSTRIMVWISAVFLLGCTAGAEYHMYKKYNVVELETLMKNPAMFRSVPVYFKCLMGKTGKVYVPMNTHFTAGNAINFGVWPEKTKLWLENEARDHYFPLLYLPKKSPEFPVFRDIKKYEVVEVFGIVRDTYAGLPWIEVTSLKRVRDPETGAYLNHFTDESLFFIKNALEYVKSKEYDFAIEDFSNALKRNLPLFAEVEILYQKGNLEVKKGDYAGARETLEACIKKDVEGKHYKALALLGEVYRQLGDFKRAVFYSRKALDLKPNYIGALRTYGISLALRKENPVYDEAERTCKRALKFDPTDPETNYYLGIICGIQKKYNKAIEYYRVAIDNLPQDHRYHKGLAGIYHERSNSPGIIPKQAVNDKEIALHEYEIVKRILKRSKKEDPDVYYFSGVIQEELGDYYLKNNDKEKAAAYYRKATKNYETCVSVDKSYKKGWYRLAARYIAYKRFKEAVDVYDNLIKMDPDSLEIRVKKAVMYHDKLNDRKNALKTLAAVLRRNDDHVETLYLTGRYLLEEGWELSRKDTKKALSTFQEAEDYLERAFKKSGRIHLRAACALVRANYELGDYRDAVDYYEAFEKLDAAGKAKISPAERVSLYLNAAVACKKERKAKRGAELLKKVLALDSDNVEAHMELALYHLENVGDVDEAVKWSRKAVALKKSWETHDLYGWCLFKKGKFEEAIKEFAKIDKTEIAKNPCIRFHLGMIYYTMKKYPKAQLYLNYPPVLDHPSFGKKARNVLREISRR